jgi:hypothetical protein
MARERMMVYAERTAIVARFESDFVVRVVSCDGEVCSWI